MTMPRPSGMLSPVLKIQRFWIERGIVFENLRNGGFRLAVDPDVLLGNQDGEPNRRLSV
jgi:hypothetical protein